MQPLNLFVPKFQVDECLAEIRECLEKGWTGFGYKTLEIERAWCSYTRLPYAHFLNSATAGLHLAVNILKRQYQWEDGDEIITTPLTFVSTNHAILYERMVPVFADVDQYLCLDPDSIAKHITKNTRAVMFVGLGGNTGQLREVAALCRDFGLKLILDAAHMSGTRYKQQTETALAEVIGMEADASVFSFHAVKNLPTADAGMICFKDRQFDIAARQLSWLGIDKDTYSRTNSERQYKWQYDVPNVGFKYHGNSIMAAIALVQLRYLESGNVYRRQLAQLYDLVLQDIPAIEIVPMAADCIPSRHLYQIMVDDRDTVMLQLNERGIYPGVHYQDNTIYPMYQSDDIDCPNARRASEHLISLPLHLNMTPSNVYRVCAALKEIVK